MTIVQDSPRRAFSLRSIAEFVFAGVCGLAFCFIGFFFLVSTITGSTAGTRDFVVYWATGQQLAHHANPYDRADLLQIERAAGLPPAYNVMYMRNPPWTLPIAYPLGLLGLRAGSALWSVLLLACLGFSVRLLWIMQGRPRNRLHLLGIVFAPALVCLVAGQSSLIALPGMVLFLYLYRTRPFWAGAALWLCALKPHLLVPFGIVLLAWVVWSKSYRLLAGAATAMIACAALITTIDPQAWGQYRDMLRASGIERDVIPCPAFFLRLWLFPNAMWFQYLPMALGCAWALAYFWPRRNTWDWMRNGSLLVLVSIVVAPYSWLFDQVLAIPALLLGVYLTGSRKLLAALVFASALIEIGLICNIWNPTALYVWTVWTGPAWLVWYLLACGSGSQGIRGDGFGRGGG